MIDPNIIEVIDLKFEKAGIAPFVYTLPPFARRIGVVLLIV